MICIYFSDLKDPLSDNNHADFSHTKDTLVSSITIVEPNLDTLEDNVKVEDDELKVGDGPEHHKDQHVDEPIETKVEHDLGVVEGRELDDKVVCEVGITFRVKSVIHLAGDNATLRVGYLVVAKGQLHV